MTSRSVELSSLVLTLFIGLSAASHAHAESGNACSTLLSREALNLTTDPTRTSGFFAHPAALDVQEINREIFGDIHSARPLILVHGTNSSLETFRAQALRLSKDRPVIIYDQRGCGKTKDPGPGYDVDVLADDLFRLANSLGLNSFDLLGHSGGAHVAMKFVEKHPQMVNRLAVEDISGIPLKERTPETLRSTYDSIRSLRSVQGKFSSSNDFTKAVAPAFGGNLAMAKRYSKMATTFGEPNVYDPHHAAAVEEFLYDSRTRDITGYLTTFKGSILLLQATPSTSFLPVEHVAAMKARRPDLHVVEINGSGHTIHADQPEAWYQAVNHYFDPRVH